MYHKLASPKYQKGIGLPATVFIIVILSMIVVAMGELTEDSHHAFAQDFHSMRAFYAAESGAQVALHRVFSNTETCAGLTDISFDADNDGLNACSVELDCQTDTVSTVAYMTFTSTASCGSGVELARRSIQVRAHL